MRKKDLPDKIRVCGKDYKVRYSNGKLTYKEKNGKRCKGNLFGFHQGNKGVIGIRLKNINEYNEPYSNDEITNTILHESLHGLSHRFDLGLTERQVYCLGVGVQALLKDNPKIYNLLK